MHGRFGVMGGEWRPCAIQLDSDLQISAAGVNAGCFSARPTGRFRQHQQTGVMDHGQA